MIFYLFLAYNHNLVRVYMKCDYTHLNHNSLMPQKHKLVTKGVIIRDYKRGLLYL
jgi:hypothetical protein